MGYSTRTIDQLNNSAPLSGGELILIWQGDQAVKTNISDLQGDMAEQILSSVSASIYNDLNIISNELSNHTTNENNPHQTTLLQLKDMVINELKDSDLIVYSDTETGWKNENKTTITDGGNF